MKWLCNHVGIHSAVECIREVVSAHVPYWKSLRMFGQSLFHSKWNQNETALSTTGNVQLKEMKYSDNSLDFERPESHDQSLESHDPSSAVGGASGGDEDGADRLISNLREVLLGY